MIMSKLKELLILLLNIQVLESFEIY